MKYSPLDYATIVYETGDATALVELLKKHWVLPWLPRILVDYEQLVKKSQKLMEVTVTSAHPLPDALKLAIERILKTYYPQSTIQTTFAIDKSLLGGFRVDSDNLIIQGSLLDQLAQLFS